MSSRRKPRKRSTAEQLTLDFAQVIQSAEVRSREQVAATDADYNPVAQTAVYMRRAVELEDAWETTIQRARQQLTEADAVELYYDFLWNLKTQIDSGVPKAPRYADLLTAVAPSWVRYDTGPVENRQPG
jgi:hypothetical protein